MRGQRALKYYRTLGLAEHLDALAKHLTEQGYTRLSSRSILICLRMVAEFLDKNGLELTALESQETISGFRAYWLHLSIARYGRMPDDNSFQNYLRAIGHLLDSGRRTGALGAEEIPSGPAIHPLLQESLDFQRIHRGLAESSLHTHRCQLEALLDFVQDQGVNNLVNLPLSLLDSFVIQQSGHLGRRALGVVVWVLRTFLSYLFFAGYEERDRSKQVSLPLTYREMTLPKYLTDEQLGQALAQIDRNTIYGKRNWAIFMVLSCLGLRAGEVRRLRLSDLNLEERRLRVDRGKGEASQVFPLTPPVEEALRIYIEQARPSSDYQEIFLTFRAPVRPFRTGGSVSQVVRTYLKGVPGLNSHGSHTLRFTFARRLRKAGAPLGLIRRTLGHSLPDTTHAYLRIAFEELQEVADNYAELL